MDPTCGHIHPPNEITAATPEADGVEIIEPGAGELAAPRGKGRMEEPEEICCRVGGIFQIARCNRRIGGPGRVRCKS